MSESTYSFLQQSGPVLCLDIGSGTQDVLLAQPGVTICNWPRFVLPSPAMCIADQIRQLTAKSKGIWLYGHTMGGGFSEAILAHIQEKLPIFSTPEAATAIHDDITRVERMGVCLSSSAPRDVVPVYLSDFSPPFWHTMLQQWGLPYPQMVLAAVQDHGIHPEGNRLGRMQAWRNLLEISPNPEQWLYGNVPSELTRLLALQRQTGGPVADTGTAAVLGAMSLPEVVKRSYREGITIINVGNSHIVAVLVYEERVVGIFEHHTEQRTLPELLQDLHEFRLGWLPDEQVRATGGHGTAFGTISEEAGAFAPTFILGPRRHILQGHGQFIAPHGDMMMAGCFGLLRAFGATYI